MAGGLTPWTRGVPALLKGSGNQEFPSVGYLFLAMGPIVQLETELGVITPVVSATRVAVKFHVP